MTVAMGVRTQFVVLFGVYVAGLVLVAVMVPERRTRPQDHPGSALADDALPGAGRDRVRARVARGVPAWTSGDYAALWRSYDPGEVARWLVYHLANLELYLAVVPLAVAPIALTLLFAPGATWF